MSVLQYPPNSIDVADVQIWNNAAFDKGEDATGEFTEVTKSSFSSLKSVSFSGSEFDSLSGKENFSPILCRSPVCIKSPRPIKPLCPNNNVNTTSQGKPLKVLFKQGLLRLNVSDPIVNETAAIRDDTKIDAEMEEIQNEITRLSIKLESLRLEKEERNSKPVERTRPPVTPKFVEQKQNSKVSFLSKKFEGAPAVSNGMKSVRKGMSMGSSEIAACVRSQRVKPEMTPIQSGKSRTGISLGPSEIAAGVKLQRGKQEITPIHFAKSKRGVSMGPSEISAGARSQQRGKKELMPIQSTQQSRRKSCFYKLQGVDEEKVTKETGGRSLSLSPKSRQAHSKIQASKQRFTTIGSNKTARKDDRILLSVQPKNLFKEAEKSAPAKRPIKSGRVVASRYNQIPAQNDLRKMSLPGNDNIEIKKFDKKCSSSVEKMLVSLPESGCNQVTENKVEVSSERMTNNSLIHNNPPSILKVADLLPKIRTIRSRYESPRDSGPAKKVAELMGKKSYFAEEERGVEASICQALSFDDDDDEEE